LNPTETNKPLGGGKSGSADGQYPTQEGNKQQQPQVKQAIEQQQAGHDDDRHLEPWFGTPDPCVVPTDATLRQIAESIVDGVVDRQLDEIALKVALEDVEEPKTQPPATPSKRISTESPVRRSKRREATADEDSLVTADRLVAIKNLEVPANNGNNLSNSILSVPDSIFASNINSIGISMGKNDNETFSSITKKNMGSLTG
jgi:hypothetical protein